MARVYVDNGHGGSEYGAYSTVKEKDINLEVSLLVQEQLHQLNFDVMLTRKTDTAVSLADRVDKANNWKADIFVSIHHNAHNGYAEGYEIYNYTNSQKGNRLGRLIGKYFDAHQVKRYIGGGMWAGAKPTSNYYVLKHTNMTAVLTEFCFIDNPKDFKKYDAEKEATCIVKGICDYFNIKYTLSNENENLLKDIKKQIVKVDNELTKLKNLIK